MSHRSWGGDLHRLCEGHHEGILRGVFQNFNPLCGRNPIETDLD